MNHHKSISRGFTHVSTCAWLAVSLLTLGHASAGELFSISTDETAQGDSFGYAVDISGGTILIGDRLNDTTAGANSGSAYLFDVQTGNMLSILTPDDAEAGDLFGRSVSLSGGTALIGSSLDDDQGYNSGSAYLFNAVTGAQQYKLTASDGSASDQFGHTVANDDLFAVVSAPWDDQGGANTGSVYVFDAATGTQQLKLTADDAQVGDILGISLAVDAGIVLAGALSNDDGINSGSAYVFNANTGEQLFKLTASDADAGDRFGSVALSGNLALIGSPYDDDDGDASGSAYLFDITTGNELFKLTASDASAGSLFGASVAISGNTVLVGAYGDDDQTGAIYGFDAFTGEELFKFTAFDAAIGDAFGFAVALDGLSALIGAPLSDINANDSGTAYLFDLPPPPVPLLGDFNHDGFIGIDDLNFMLLHWNEYAGFQQPQIADLTGDGLVGLDDLNWLLMNWNTGTPPTAEATEFTIPEPGSAALLLGLGLMLAGRKRLLI